jgi:hypothetical protein
MLQSGNPVQSGREATLRSKIDGKIGYAVTARTTVRMIKQPCNYPKNRV